MFKLINFIKHKLTEKTVGNLFLIFVTFYIVGYGLFISRGFHLIIFNPFSSVLLLTVFLIDSIKTLMECMSKSEFYRGDQDLSKVTVIIPTKNGGAFLENTIKDLIKRFDRKSIIVASNGSTDNTCERANKYGVVVIDHPSSLGKVTAINMALHKVNTPYTLLIDDDTLVGNAIIPTQALDDGYDAVAFRVLPKVQNWISKIQMYEYRKSMDIGRRFHNDTATVQSISGAIGLFHTTELVRQSDLHTGEFSGEDLQRTLLIHMSHGSKGAVISDSIIETEVPDTIRKLIDQRIYGWNPGLLSNIFKYFNLLFRSKRTHILLRYEAFYNSVLVVGIDLLRFISFPVIIFYPMYFLALYIVYVLTETIPYFVMKRQDPYWVILIYPIYGLISFLTRIVSIAVFIYRRSSVAMNDNLRIDDYRESRFIHKIISISMILMYGGTAIFLSALYGNKLAINKIAQLEATPNNSYQYAIADPEIIVSKSNEEIKERVLAVPEFYNIPLEKGDGKIKIVRKAVLEHLSKSNLYISSNDFKVVEQRLVEKMVMDLPRYKDGIVVPFPSNMIIDEINKTQLYDK